MDAQIATMLVIINITNMVSVSTIFRIAVQLRIRCIDSTEDT